MRFRLGETFDRMLDRMLDRMTGEGCLSAVDTLPFRQLRFEA